MKSLLLGIIIGVGIASLAWMSLIELGNKLDSISSRLNRHEHVINALIELNSQEP